MTDSYMLRWISNGAMRRIHDRLHRLYGDVADRSLERLSMLLGRYGLGMTARSPHPKWTQLDAVLITYGDTIQKEGERPLVSLRRFLIDWLQRAVSTVHILPFCPYSSDDGFSVIDYRQVDPALGKWRDIERISRDFRLMVDLVLNHVSRKSEWFESYSSGIAPERDYFLEADPNWDLSSVARPRNLPLLTEVETRLGRRLLWTTFSKDQIDLNFANPDVLFEFLDILLLNIFNGARVVRLDAIAYLWKKPGTPCIHLPETHEVVKLIRDFCAMVAPDVLLITETNVPHEENISYFGNGDEADIVYQFSLPPLLLHGLQTGNASHLTQWASQLQDPPEGCTFLNFTASHDGIGVRPLEGILTTRAMNSLAKGIVKRGGQVSFKANADGSKSPYELNITYLDALADPAEPDDEKQIARFLCSQTVALGLKGIPAIYFHSLVGTQNDTQAVAQTGRARSINRHKYTSEELNHALTDNSSVSARIFTAYLRRLRTRSSHAAFHPDGAQRVLDLGPRLFAFERTAPDDATSVLCVNNFSKTSTKVDLAEKIPAAAQGSCRELLGNDYCDLSKPLKLAPYQTVWLEYPNSKT